MSDLETLNANYITYNYKYTVYAPYVKIQIYLFILELIQNYNFVCDFI